MSVRYDYLSHIRSLIPMSARHMATSALDGGFRSTQTGRSMDFRDLREYIYGDDVKDIDWKSSARVGRVLIRRFVAERRRNVLVIADAGAKMEADTSAGDDKQTVAVDVAGTFAYLGLLCGDSVGFLYGTPRGPVFTGFHDSAHRYEMMMARLDRAICDPGACPLSRTVGYALDAIRRRALVVVVTDQDGLPALDGMTLRRLAVQHDVIVVDIDDAYLMGPVLWDGDGGRYERAFMLSDPVVVGAERAERTARLDAFAWSCHDAGVRFGTVASDDEIPDAALAILRDVPGVA